MKYLVNSIQILYSFVFVICVEIDAKPIYKSILPMVP